MLSIASACSQERVYASMHAEHARIVVRTKKLVHIAIAIAMPIAIAIAIAVVAAAAAAVALSLARRMQRHSRW